MDVELPETDDPFELLGVDRAIDERDLKRAYAQLIRRHRPERDPDNFQRIHAAYEQAKQMVRWGIADAVCDAEESAAEAESESESASASASETESEAAGPPPLELDELAAALKRGERVAVATLDQVDAAELGSIAADDALGWTVLRQQDETAAAILFSARIAQLLWDERTEQVIDELRAPRLQDDIVASPELEWTFRQAINALVWTHLDAADELNELFAHDTIHASYLGERYAELRMWAPLPERVSPELRRLIRLGSIVGYEREHELERALGDKAAKHPSAVVESLGVLEYHRPGLLDYLGYSTATIGGALYNEDEDEDEPNYTGLLEQELEPVVKQIKSGRFSRDFVLLAVLGVVAVVFTAAYANWWWTLLVAAATLVAPVRELMMADATTGYSELLRPALARIIGLDAVPYHAVRDYCLTHPHLRKYTAELSNDSALAALSSLRQRLDDDEEDDD